MYATLEHKTHIRGTSELRFMSVLGGLGDHWDESYFHSSSRKVWLATWMPGSAGVMRAVGFGSCFKSAWSAFL